METEERRYNNADIINNQIQDQTHFKRAFNRAFSYWLKVPQAMKLYLVNGSVEGRWHHGTR